MQMVGSNAVIVKADSTAATGLLPASHTSLCRHAMLQHRSHCVQFSRQVMPSLSQCNRALRALQTTAERASFAGRQAPLSMVTIWRHRFRRRCKRHSMA